MNTHKLEPDVHNFSNICRMTDMPDSGSVHSSDITVTNSKCSVLLNDNGNEIITPILEKLLDDMFEIHDAFAFNPNKLSIVASAHSNESTLTRIGKKQDNLMLSIYPMRNLRWYYIILTCTFIQIFRKTRVFILGLLSAPGQITILHFLLGLTRQWFIRWIQLSKKKLLEKEILVLFEGAASSMEMQCKIERYTYWVCLSCFFVFNIGNT